MHLFADSQSQVRSEEEETNFFNEMEKEMGIKEKTVSEKQISAQNFKLDSDPISLTFTSTSFGFHAPPPGFSGFNKPTCENNLFKANKAQPLKSISPIAEEKQEEPVDRIDSNVSTNKTPTAISFLPNICSKPSCFPNQKIEEKQSIPPILNEQKIVQPVFNFRKGSDIKPQKIPIFQFQKPLNNVKEQPVAEAAKKAFEFKLKNTQLPNSELKANRVQVLDVKNKISIITNKAVPFVPIKKPDQEVRKVDNAPASFYRNKNNPIKAETAFRDITVTGRTEIKGFNLASSSSLKTDEKKLLSQRFKDIKDNVSRISEKERALRKDMIKISLLSQNFFQKLNNLSILLKIEPSNTHE